MTKSLLLPRTYTIHLPFSPKPQPSGAHPLLVLTFVYIGNQTGSGSPFPDPFCLHTEPIQNLYNSSAEPVANRRISASIVRPESARKPARAAPRFPPIFDQKCNIPIGTFFCNIFPPLLPLFLSGQEPQKQKCYTFAENATPSRPLLQPPAAPPKDRPSATEMMNSLPPHKLCQNCRVRTYQTPGLCPFPESQNSSELTFTSTNDKTAAGPHSYLLQKRRQFTRLTPHSSPFFPRLLVCADLRYERDNRKALSCQFNVPADFWRIVCHPFIIAVCAVAAQY